MSGLDITEVARRAGVPASTLRFYEEKGLIRSVGRRGLHRVFEASVLERLALIALGRAAGFSLDEIARMFTPDGRPRIDRQQLAEKADQLDQTIRKLSGIRDGLRHAADCRAPSHMECPTFRRILRATAAGALGKREKATPKPRSASATKGRARRALTALAFCAALSSTPALAGPIEVLRYVSFHPNDPSTYAVVYSEVGGGVLITRDGGESFALLCGAAQTNVDSIDSLVPHALWTGDGRLLYGGFDGLFRSDPQGCNFAPAERLGSAHLRGLASDPADPSTVYAVTASSRDVSGLYVSRDAGGSWQALYESETAYFRGVVAAAGANGATRIATSIAEAVDGGLSFSYLESTNDGQTFEAHPLPDGAEATLLGFDARSPETAYAAVKQAGGNSIAIMARTAPSEDWSTWVEVEELGSFVLAADGGFELVDSAAQKVLRVSAGSATELAGLASAMCLARQPATGKTFVCRGQRLHQVVEERLVQTPTLDLSSVPALVDCSTSPDVAALCASALAYGFCSPTHFPQAPVCQGSNRAEDNDGAAPDAGAAEPDKKAPAPDACVVPMRSPGARAETSLAPLLALVLALVSWCRRRGPRERKGCSPSVAVSLTALELEKTS